MYLIDVMLIGMEFSVEYLFFVFCLLFMWSEVKWNELSDWVSDWVFVLFCFVLIWYMFCWDVGVCVDRVVFELVFVLVFWCWF